MNNYNIAQKQSTYLYKLIKFIHSTFMKYNIEYWVTGGTLLGAVRHGGLIPWDDDGDICVMVDQVPKLRKIKEYCKRHGYTIDQMEDGENDNIKCCGKGPHGKDICDWYIGHKNSELGCDIFVMIPDPKKPSRITYGNPYWRNAPNGGKKCYYELEHLYPLVPLHFGNYFVYGPNNSIEHLNHCYGSSWNYQAQMLYNHRTGKWHTGKLRTMKSKDFHPPKPPASTKQNNPPPIKKYKKIYRSRSSTKRSKKIPQRHSRRPRRSRRT